jgi:hypothetical protein
LQEQAKVSMKKKIALRIGFAYAQVERYGAAYLGLWTVVGCATAHFDPQRNQALTFDTASPNDAGIAQFTLQPTSMKSAPSQPGATEVGRQPQGSDAGPVADAIICTIDPPDPKPLHTREWIDYEFAFKEGTVEVQSVQLERTEKPRDTARVVGRYAVELWIGCELIDRVRFGFPLQAAEHPTPPGTRHALNEQPSLTANAHLARTVRVPHNLRATRAELVDRGTGKRSSLAWPPNLPSAEPRKPQ